MLTLHVNINTGHGLVVSVKALVCSGVIPYHVRKRERLTVGIIWTISHCYAVLGAALDVGPKPFQSSSATRRTGETADKIRSECAFSYSAIAILGIRKCFSANLRTIRVLPVHISWLSCLRRENNSLFIAMHTVSAGGLWIAQVEFGVALWMVLTWSLGVAQRDFCHLKGKNYSVYTIRKD